MNDQRDKCEECGWETRNCVCAVDSEFNPTRSKTEEAKITKTLGDH